MLIAKIWARIKAEKGSTKGLLIFKSNKEWRTKGKYENEIRRKQEHEREWREWCRLDEEDEKMIRQLKNDEWHGKWPGLKYKNEENENWKTRMKKMTRMANKSINENSEMIIDNAN